MKRHLLIAFLGLTVGLLILLLILLFVPPVSKWVIRTAALSALGHELRVERYTFSLNSLDLFGTFDDNSTVEVKAYHLLSVRRQAEVGFNGNAALFSLLADFDIPRILLAAQLHYTQEKMTLDAQLLEGTLSAEMELKTMRYGFALYDIDIGEVLELQNLPRYASGRININGKGTASEKALQDINLTSYDMKMQAPLLSMLALPSLPSVLPATLTGELRMSHDTLLQTTCSLSSEPFMLSFEDARYDITTGMFALPVKFENSAIAEILIKSIDAAVQGVYADQSVHGDMRVLFDQYRIELRQVVFDTEHMDLQSRYRLASRQTQPLNLTAMNELYGTMQYRPDAAILTVASENIVHPLRMSLRDNAVELNASKLPLQPLLEMFNLDAPLSGRIDVNATADIGVANPKVRFKAKSSDLNVSAIPLPFELNATGDQQRIYADLHADSAFWKALDSKILFNIKKRILSISATASAVNAPSYNTPELHLDAHIDLNRSLIENTQLSSPYDVLSIPHLQYAEPYSGSAHFAFSQLQRVLPGADPEVRLDGNISIAAKEQGAFVEIETTNLGRFDGVIHTDSLQLHGRQTSLETLCLLAGIGPMLQGTMQSNVDINAKGVFAKMHVDTLRPRDALKESLRPIPLTITAAFDSCNARYLGSIDVMAGNDSLVLSSMQIDLSRKRLLGSYRLNVPEPSDAFLILPDDLFAAPLAADGNFSLTPQRQSLSLQSKRIVLKERYRKMLDANASGPLPLRMNVTAKHENAQVSVTADIDSEYARLSPVSGYYDTNRSHFALTVPLHTTIYPGDTTLDVRGDRDANGTINNTSALINTESSSMQLDNLYLDMNRGDYRGSLRIALQSRADTSGRTAELKGHFSTLPSLEGAVGTEAFGGNLNVAVNEAALMAVADDVNISRVEAFFVASPQIKRGLLNARILLTAPALQERNVSTLSGGVDLRVSDLYIEGIEFDSYLETLRGTQDLSLFQGSVSELPIIRNVKSLPSELLKKKMIRTIVPHARVALAVDKGKAICEDCALATERHRIAFAGDIDLPTRQFDQFYFALLNPEGCPYYMQRIHGSLIHPEISLAASGVKVVGGAVVSLASNVTDAANWVAKTADTLMSATGDVVGYVPLAGKAADNVLKGTGDALYKGTSTLSGCTPFYLGSVPHPQKN